MPVPKRLGNQNLDQLAQEFVAPIAEHFFGRSIQKYDCAVTLYFDNGVRSGLEKIAKAPIRLDVEDRLSRFRVIRRRPSVVINSVRARVSLLQRSPPVTGLTNSLTSVAGRTVSYSETHSMRRELPLSVHLARAPQITGRLRQYDQDRKYESVVAAGQI